MSKTHVNQMVGLRLKFAIGSLGLILLGVSALGCGSDRGIPMVAVAGQIRFEGAPPPATGKLIFSPLEPAPGSSPGAEGKWAARPGEADFDEQGNFCVTSFEEGDGLVPGSYLVTVLCYRETPTLANAESVSYVPRDFRHQVDIDANGPSSVNLEIEVPLKK